MQKIGLVLSLTFCVVLLTGCGGDDSPGNGSPINLVVDGVDDPILEYKKLNHCTNAQINGELRGKWWKKDSGINTDRCIIITDRLTKTSGLYNQITDHISEITDGQGLCWWDTSSNSSERYAFDRICIIDL